MMLRICNTLQRAGNRKFSTDATATLSKRKQFRQIPLDYKIVNKLDELQLGYNSKRKVRISLAKKFGNLRGKAPMTQKESIQQVLKHQMIESPYPFRKYGLKLHNASTFLDVPNKFYGNPTPPEVALIGRSNVGKSTLVNSLLSFDDSYVQKADVSDKPGLTKQLQFYGLGIYPIKENDNKNTSNNTNTKINVSDKTKMINETASSIQQNSTITNTTTEIKDTTIAKKCGSALVLVDMPGYGFSYMNENELYRVKKLCSDYLRYRGSTLKRVILLLDARHGFKVADKLYFKNLVDGMTENDQYNNHEESKDSSKHIKTSNNNNNNSNNNDDNINKKYKPKTNENIVYFEFNNQNGDSTSSNSPKKINSFIQNTNTTTNSNTEQKHQQQPQPLNHLKKRKVQIAWKLQLVLTKCDLLDRNELARRIQVIQDSITEMLPGYGNMLSVIALSGKYGNGVLDLKRELSSLVTPPPLWENTNSANNIHNATNNNTNMNSNKNTSIPMKNTKSSSISSSSSVTSPTTTMHKYIPPVHWVSSLPPITRPKSTSNTTTTTTTATTTSTTKGSRDNKSKTTFKNSNRYSHDNNTTYTNSRNSATNTNTNTNTNNSSTNNDETKGRKIKRSLVGVTLVKLIVQ